MADIADFANDLVLEHIALALAARKAIPVFESYEFCVDCDSTILPARRAAVTNCIRCTDCQELNDMLGARHVR